MKWTALRSKQKFLYLLSTYKKSLEWLVHIEMSNLDVLTWDKFFPFFSTKFGTSSKLVV